eukprot:303987-Alexandrium_andersonii.AAC.1
MCIRDRLLAGRGTHKAKLFEPNVRRGGAGVLRDRDEGTPALQQASACSGARQLPVVTSGGGQRIRPNARLGVGQS